MCLGTTCLMFVRHYVLFRRPLADVLLYVLPLAPTTPALTVGNPVRVRLRGRPPPNPQPRSSRPHPRSPAQWYFVVANRHPSPGRLRQYPPSPPPPPPTTACPLLPTQSGFTPHPARHHALLQCMQPRSLDSAPTSQSIASRRSSPRAAQPQLDSRAIPMRFPTTHTVFEEVHPPRAAARRTWLRRFGPPRQHTAGGVWLGPTRRTHPSIHPAPSPEPPRDLCPARGGDAPRARRAPTHPPSEAIESFLDSRRSRTLSRAGLSIELCRARGARLPQLVAGYCRGRRVLACPGAGRGCIAAHRAPSSVIHPRAPAASPRRAHYTRASSPAVLSIGAAAGELSPPQLAAEKILRHGAERSNPWPQVPKHLSLGLDYTNRPLSSLHLLCISSTPRRATGAHLHPGLFAAHLISSRRALPHLDYAMMRFRGDAGSRRCACAAAGLAGSGSFWGSLPPYQYSHGVLARPSDPSITHLDRTARYSRRRSRCSSVTCTRRPGSSGRRRRCTEHAGFTLPCSKHADRRAYPSGFIGDLLYDATSWYSLVRRGLSK
ncbi:hypothetical protein B0H14DRAFT_352587 [Mycena olivaceomarginata]|nr:hypothetical protein B0H14DRAFT_352587 [Mycena olivaceomarginata]